MHTAVLISHHQQCVVASQLVAPSCPLRRGPLIAVELEHRSSSCCVVPKSLRWKVGALTGFSPWLFKFAVSPDGKYFAEESTIRKSTVWVIELDVPQRRIVHGGPWLLDGLCPRRPDPSSTFSTICQIPHRRLADRIVSRPSATQANPKANMIAVKATSQSRATRSFETPS